MLHHLRANLWLLVLTVVLCSILYPVALWAVGQSVFRAKAEGSLINKSGWPVTSAGAAVGSRLIAQPFSGDQYFQPRPSATSPAYNAAASGASNWGASNPLLRDRVARQLGPIVKHSGAGKRGQLVGPDVERWFQAQAANFAGEWAKDHSSLAEQWIKDHTESAARWLGKEPDDLKNDTAESSKTFFALYAKKHPGTWPGEEEIKSPEGKAQKHIKPVREGTDVQAYLFDPWLQAHPDVALEKVPADMVMASASGLDPHITLKNALYQLDRVAGKWAAETKRDSAQVGKEIEELLRRKAEAPLGGLIGVDLVNVLEVNLALRERYETRARANR